MLGPELADRAHSLAVWCQVWALAERDQRRREEYERWASRLEDFAVAVRLEIEFVRSLSGADGRIPESDQALLEAFSQFTLKSIRR